jgi:hypothetical protein
MATILNDLVGVQPMTQPNGNMYHMNYATNTQAPVISGNLNNIQVNTKATI